MQKELENLANKNGDKLKLIPVGRLNDLKNVIEEFKSKNELNNFQEWIVDNLYSYRIPDADFKINSIILIVISHAFYANVNFKFEGKNKRFFCLVRSDFDKTTEYLHEFSTENGYHILEAKALPLKRLGTHSGLAKYGRNNITYVDGMGSNFSYAAYFTDIICESDSWGEAKNAELCNSCDLCVRNCPTQAILKDRFLIDNKRCLSFFNESPGEFPEWIPTNAHHTLYDCLICQKVCPMNKDQINKTIEDIYFNKEETNQLLSGTPIDVLSSDMKEKIFRLGIDEWYTAIPRNLKTLFEF